MRPRSRWQPGRPPHSLHSYFVRSGRLDVPLTMQVERIRDGRSYTVRGVEALQEGEVILDLIASFQVPETATATRSPCRRCPTPTTSIPSRSTAAASTTRPIETRIAAVADGPPPAPFGSAIRFWARSTETWVDDDPGLAAAYLAYVADLRTGTGLVDQ